MTYIYRLNENFTNNIPDNLLTIISLLSIISGIFVIISKNPIVSVLFLIGLFLSIASYLMILGMSFIGLSYLLVYVGAVSILFLFILMLINVRVSELTTDNNNSVPLSIVTIIIFSISFYNKVPATSSITNANIFYSNIGFISQVNSFEKENNVINNVYLATSHNWDSALTEISHISGIGNILYTNYPILLIITSIILLLAMIGAIVITIKQ